MVELPDNDAGCCVYIVVLDVDLVTFDLCVGKHGCEARGVHPVCRNRSMIEKPRCADGERNIADGGESPRSRFLSDQPFEQNGVLQQVEDTQSSGYDERVEQRALVEDTQVCNYGKTT
jgi:hypothetical protein